MLRVMRILSLTLCFRKDTSDRLEKAWIVDFDREELFSTVSVVIKAQDVSFPLDRKYC